MAVLAVASMTLGLLISASVNTSEKTMPLLVISVMFQVILTGGVFGLNGKAGLDQISWLAPSRWGYAATASTSNLNVIQQPVLPKTPAVTPPSTGPGKKKHPGKSGGTSAPSAPASGSAPAGGSGNAPASTSSPGATSSATPSPSSSATPTPTTSVSPSASTAALVKAPKPHHKHKKAHASASPSASTSAPSTPPASTADTGLTTDPLWDHKSKTWIKNMASMVLLGIFFSLIAWWRLVRLSPGRRR
jgi:hypothetical protein